MTAEKDFEICYHDQVVTIHAGDNYRLTFPDGRWVLIHCYPDDTQTTSVDNANISYSLASVWVIEDKAPGAGFLTTEEIQVVGELIKRKEAELNKLSGTA
ncbi:MAG: hypothetical protein ABJB86_01235 [Bacteroidota bacterium]